MRIKFDKLIRSVKLPKIETFLGDEQCSHYKPLFKIRSINLSIGILT